MRYRAVLLAAFAYLSTVLSSTVCAEVTVVDGDDTITIDTPHLQAVVRKSGYVTGVAAGTLLDKATGTRDLGFGLDIVDWIMEPGSDEAYREKLPDHMVYEFGNAWHGKGQKRSIEGPQICTKAGRVDTRVVRGKDFAAVELKFKYTLAAPGHKPGSQWTQWLVFPNDARYFISSDRIESVNSSEAMFLRLDMPGHIKHKGGDTFSEVYLSYLGEPAGQHIPAKEFAKNFAPDERFNYQRDEAKVPKRFIRGYQFVPVEEEAAVDQPVGKRTATPWLLGMTLDPAIVSEAWCHQRDYLCMIEEFGGRPIKAGQAFSAAFIVGYFDTIDEANKLYDAHKGAKQLEVDEKGWRLVK